jgi:AcrR family transcriptional regulator
MTKPATRKGIPAPPPGSPGWWESRPERATGPRRGRPPRSFEPIVDAAARLVDEGGTRSFSMRALAERLDTSTATLYRHVNGRDELMVYVLDRLFAEIEQATEGPDPASWQEGARQVALRFHQALAQHPNLLPLLVNQVPVGPHALAVRERTIAMLIRFGFTASLAARAFTALAHYVIGFAAQQLPVEQPAPHDPNAIVDYYRRLDRERYPSINAAADDLSAVPLETEFLEELRFIIDGIDRARRRT